MSINRISAESFGPEDELFLFGDESAFRMDETDPLYTFKHGQDAIFGKKHALSYGWLAQFWQGEIPEYFFDEEAADRKWHEDIHEQVSVESGQEAKRLRLIRENPVESALYLEWLNDYAPQPITERPVFSTALYFAYKALANDARRDAKLSYVVDLTVAADQTVWGTGESTPPQPIEGYADKPFPVHLLDS